SSNPVPGFTRPAARLRELRFTFRHDRDVRRLLSAEMLPALRALSLCGGWFTGAVPDHYRGLADVPLLGQLRRLLLSEFPPEVTAGILGRRDLALERLGLYNRHYVRNLVDYQQNACRLDAETVRRLARSTALPLLTHLTVQNERVGDVILELVEA